MAVGGWRPSVRRGLDTRARFRRRREAAEGGGSWRRTAPIGDLGSARCTGGRGRRLRCISWTPAGYEGESRGVEKGRASAGAPGHYWLGWALTAGGRVDRRVGLAAVASRRSVDRAVRIGGGSAESRLYGGTSGCRDHGGSPRRLSRGGLGVASAVRPGRRSLRGGRRGGQGRGIPSRR